MRPVILGYVLMLLLPSVADPGFDLRGGVDFVNGRGGGRKSSERVVK